MNTRNVNQQSQANTTRPPGTPVIADVSASSKAGGGVEFSLKWRFQDETDRREGPIELPRKKCEEPGTMIHFHLHHSPDRMLEFDTADPIWVSRSGCPKQPSSDAEIPTDQINPRPKLLKVYDRNQDTCELEYTLLFKDEDGNIEPFDPMIRNGGTH